jgi:predicted transcriptional regulator
MRRVTISLDDELFEQGQRLARKLKVSFSSLLRQLLQARIRNESKNWVKDWFKLIEKANYGSGGRRDWKRKDLYRF